jgi:hypothetical protein
MNEQGDKLVTKIAVNKFSKYIKFNEIQLSDLVYMDEHRRHEM